jgi:hypothetical protein
VDRAVDGFEELPEGGGGGVAEDGFGAAGEDGSHETRVEVRGAVPHGVDALVDAIQLTFANADRDRFGAKTALFELPASDRTVLACRDSRGHPVGRVAFWVHTDA